MNPNDATLRRVYTRVPGTTTPDTTLKVGQPFDVVVEGEAGDVLGQSEQPYRLFINAIDLTAVNNPGFSLNKKQIFSTAGPSADTGNLKPWLSYAHREPFTAPASLVNHIVQFSATLVSQNQIVSFVQSDPVIFIS